MHQSLQRWTWLKIRETSHGTLTRGEETIELSSSEVHLGVDRNLSGTLDMAAKTCRRTMYAMMGAGA